MTPFPSSPVPQALSAHPLQDRSGQIHPGSLKALWLAILAWLDARAALRADARALDLLDERARLDLGLSAADVDRARDMIRRELWPWT